MTEVSLGAFDDHAPASTSLGGGRRCDFDTVLSVHTSPDCSVASEICNDDYVLVGPSRVDAVLNMGDMVTIVVDGYGPGEEGNYVPTQMQHKGATRSMQHQIQSPTGSGVVLAAAVR